MLPLIVLPLKTPARVGGLGSILLIAGVVGLEGGGFRGIVGLTSTVRAVKISPLI